MDIFTVAQFMRSSSPIIHPDQTFKDAVVVMLEHKTNGLVVVDELKKVVGIISSWDLIQYIVPDYLEQDMHLAAFEAGATLEERVHSLANVTIKNVMTKEVCVIKKEATLMEAAALLSQYRIRQLPVVDDAGILCGYLNRTDIKFAIAKILGIL